MAVDRKVIEWAQQLRNMTTTAQILSYQCEWLDNCPLTNWELKQEAKTLKRNLDRALVNIRNIKIFLKNNGRQDAAEQIAEELAGDKVHDLNNHMIYMAQFVNVAEITDVLREHVESQTKPFNE